MKQILTIALVPLLLFSCNNEENKEEEKEKVVAANSDWATEHLKGEVKTIEESSYTPDENGKIGEMDSCCTKLTVYNERGFDIQLTEKDDKGTLMAEIKVNRMDDDKFKSYTRHEKGKKVFERVTTYKENGTIDYAEDIDTTNKVVRVHREIIENEIGQAVLGKTYNGKRFISEPGLLHTQMACERQTIGRIVSALNYSIRKVK